MADLTESQKISISKILGVTVAEVTLQNNWMGAVLTTVMITALDEEIDRWANAGTQFTSFKAMESNKGFEKSAESEKKDIQRNIAILLERPDWAANSSGAAQGMLVRG